MYLLSSLQCAGVCIRIEEIPYFNYFAIYKCKQTEYSAFKGATCISGYAFTLEDHTYLVIAINVLYDFYFIISK